MKEPWRWIDARELAQIPIGGDLDAEERRALYWAGRDYLRGEGHAVDVGAFLGLSSYCLGRGIADNPDRRGRSLFAVDSFLVTDRTAHRLQHLKDLSPKFRGSIYEVFLRNVERVRDVLHPTMADPTRVTWTEGPIEVLAVDCALPREQFGAIYDRFFPHVLAGGLLVFKDYFALEAYALPVLTAALKRDLLFLGQVGTSALFTVRDPSALKVPFAERVAPDPDLSPVLERVIQFVGGRETPAGQLLSTQKMYLDGKVRGPEAAMDEFHSLGLSFLPEAVRAHVIVGVTAAGH